MRTYGKDAAVNSRRICLSIFCCVIFAAILESVTGGAADAGFYSYSRETKIRMAVGREMIAVRFAPESTSEQRQIIVESETTLRSFSAREEVSDYRISLLRLREGVTEKDVSRTIQALNARTEVEYANPVFAYPKGILIPTDEFIVKFASGVSRAEIRALNQANGIEVLEVRNRVNWYLLRVKAPKNVHALEMANRYYEDPMTAFSVPNFVIRGKLAARVIPNDEYFREQWCLDNTEQHPGDADISAPEGWETSTGSPDIVIAIIDTGVDLSHEDLVDKLVDGYDTDESDDDASPETTFAEDAHGTACAGLAAATTDNATGVAGMAVCLIGT